MAKGKESNLTNALAQASVHSRYVGQRAAKLHYVFTSEVVAQNFT